MVEPDLLEQSGYVCSRALDLAGVEARRRDAGDTRELDELRDRGVEVTVENLENVAFRRHGGAA